MKLRVKKKNSYKDPKGREHLAKNLKDEIILEDFVANELVTEAEEIEKRIKQLKEKTLSYMEQYQQRIAKQNKVEYIDDEHVTLTSFDGTKKVSIESKPFLEFTTGLQQAFNLIMEVITEGTNKVAQGLQTIILDAFRSKKGQVNKSKVLGLTVYMIDDPRWKKAMKLILESKKVQYSKKYPRFKKQLNGEWVPIHINISKIVL